MLSNTIYDTFKKSVEQNDYNSCCNAIIFFIRFMEYGIDHKKYSIVNKYYNLPNDFVYLSLKNNELKNKVIDYLSLKIKEQYEYYLIHTDYNMNDIDKLKEFNKLSSLIIVSFNFSFSSLLIFA